MSDEVSLMEWGFKGLVSIVLATGGWLWAGLVKSVGRNKDDLAAHKLYVAENYIKKDVVERIHTRFDGVARKEDVDNLKEEVTEIRTDIKSILKMLGGHGRDKEIG